MDNKKDLIIYWVSTGLLSAMMLTIVGVYLFNNEEVSQEFHSLGFPTYLVYPLAMAKFLGIIAIVSNVSYIRREWLYVGFLREWAYAGFLFNFILAFSAHIQVGDGDHWGAVIALVLLIASYLYDKKTLPEK